MVAGRRESSTRRREISCDLYEARNTTSLVVSAVYPAEGASSSTPVATVSKANTRTRSSHRQSTRLRARPDPHLTMSVTAAQPSALASQQGHSRKSRKRKSASGQPQSQDHSKRRAIGLLQPEGAPHRPMLLQQGVGQLSSQLSQQAPMLAPSRAASYNKSSHNITKSHSVDTTHHPHQPQTDIYGRTPLHQAAMDGNLEEVERILSSEEKSDVSVVDKYGLTPLHLAAGSGASEVVKVLLSSEVKPDINTKRSDGSTPLHDAAYSGYQEVVKILLACEAKSDVSVVDKYGQTPLHLAAESGVSEVVKMLLSSEEKVDVNCRDNGGRTPLHDAAREGHAEVIKLLLASEAQPDLNSRDKYGWTPLHLASYRGYVAEVSLLVARGAAVTVVDKEGKSPLDLTRNPAVKAALTGVSEGGESSSAASTDKAPPESIDHLKRLEHMRAYEKAVLEKLVIEICVLRLNCIGLPRSGKTTFLLRMLGDLLNIEDAQSKGAKEQPSTGLAEERGQIVIRNTSREMGAISSKSWFTLKDLEEEANMIIKWVHQCVRESLPSAVPSSPTPVSQRSEVSSAGVKHYSTSTAGNESGQLPPTSPEKKKELDFSNILSVFMRAMQSEDWDKVSHALKDTTLVIGVDTGGHIELLDMHAATVHGPSLNLIFRRLTDPLDKEFKVRFTDEHSVSSEEEDSILTVEDVIFQALSSIASFCCSFVEGASSTASSEAPSSQGYKPGGEYKAMFVGTYGDKVSTEEFKREDQLLQDKIRNTDFHDKGIIEYAFKDQLMLAVDNMRGGQEEIQQNQQALGKVIRRCFKKVKIPASWFALNLFMRSLKVRTMSLERCEELAMEVEISAEELQHTLWFLHDMGFLLYYPNVPALKGTIICDIQVLFDSATNLVKKTFSFDRVGKLVCEKFRETGRFTEEDVKRAASGHTDDLIPLEKLIELLKYLNILTTIPPLASSQEGQQTYFMPCILKRARVEEMSIPVRTEQDPPPLMIRYNCGYTPGGLFPAMITSLVSQNREDWKMIEAGLRKNRVQFYVGKDYDTITLLLYPHFIEIAIKRDHSCPFEVPTERVCGDLLTVIKSTLENVTSCMNHRFTMGYKFGFKCPSHPGRDHLCVLSSERAVKMECLQNPKKNVIVRMQPHHLVWFKSSRANAGSKASVTVPNQPLNESVPQAISEVEFSRVLAMLQRHAHKWKRIGQGLGFTADELSIIEATPTLFTSAPLSYLDTMLSDWQQWAPGDYRGSTDYATLASLKSAVNSAGLGRTAQEL